MIEDTSASNQAKDSQDANGAATDSASFVEQLRELGLMSPKMWKAAATREQGPSHSLVAGMLTRRSINIAVGDSGLGKTTVFMQLCICMAGISFLGQECQRGRAIYFSYEDDEVLAYEQAEAISRFLGLPGIPEDFIVWFEGDKVLQIGSAVRQLEPALVVIEPLRRFDSRLEDPKKVAEAFNAHSPLWRGGPAIILVHHLKKPQDGKLKFGLTEDGCRVNTWLEDASGSRALVNHAKTRMAFEEPPSSSQADLVMRWNKRGRGDSAPLLLRKVLDQHGEPVGWERAIGIDLLRPEDQAAFRKLSDSFKYTEAKRVVGGKSDSATMHS